MTIADHTTGLITAPGVYDIPSEAYHADPVPGGSLSSSGARLLLPPNCPAIYRHRAENPQPPKRTYDLGHAAHKMVLGSGPELVVVDADDWRTKAAREKRDAAYAAGAVPLLAAEHEQVQDMAAALRQHRIANALLNPAAGRPEQSLFWVDQQAKVWRRARLDWLPDTSNGRMIVPDYKTTQSAALDAIQKSVHTYGYHQQATWYLDAVQALDLADSAAFVFIFQEKTAPYLVTVVELDVTALQIGRTLNRKAIDIYRQCQETGRWPGYSDDVELIALPPYAEIRHEAAVERGDYDLTETYQ